MKKTAGKRSFVEVMRKDLVVGVTEKNTENRRRWKQMICCGDP